MIADKVTHHLTPEALASFQDAFARDPRSRLAANAVANQSVHSVALNRPTVTDVDHIFSHVLPSNRTTSQKRSGRCWMFAGLNLFRSEAKARLNLEDFEFSQNYLMFWDKLEKSNYFLENIIQTAQEPVDGRLVSFLLQRPIQDGGQWDMFVNLVRKYGVVPKSVMPETHSSSATPVMNRLITSKLREFAARLRQQAAEGASEDALQEVKTTMLGRIYHMLAVHLGEPPKSFDWQWQDKDNTFTRSGTLTPQAFFEEFVGMDLDDLVCLIHCPLKTRPYGQSYTIEYLGNVVEGQPIRYLNVPLDVFKQAAKDMLVEGQPVWFGCDVGKYRERDKGILDTALYDYDLVYGEPFNLSKAERLNHGDSVMTHAMVFTGVDVPDSGQPRKWRVENSWGEQIGDKGFFVMTDAWFDEYMYEVLVDKRYVPQQYLSALTQAPVVLPPWDPMGALATAE
jgi:bleomycin hydrolase